MPVVSLPVPRVDAASCAAGGSGGDGCRLCAQRCPYDAIRVRERPEGAVVHIDPAVCQRCGACSGACPTSAIERPFLPDRELVGALLLAAAAGDHGVVAITCEASAGQVADRAGPAATVVVPSLLILDETHLASAVAAGARAVVLVGCPRCTHDEPQLLIEPLSVARALLDDPQRVAYVEDGPGGRLDTALATAGSLPSVDALTDAVDLEALSRADTRRERLAVLLTALEGPAACPLAAAGFGSVSLDPDACVMCGACAVACPTDALRLDPTEASLSLRMLDCIGCGACVSACPDEALTLEPAVPVGPGALERRPLLTDAPVTCMVCGHAYAPARLLEHARSVLDAAGLDPTDPRFQLGVCPTCRRIQDRTGPLAPEDGATISRRRFLAGAATTAAAGMALPLLHGRTPAIAVEQEPVIRPGRMGMVIDLERCIGCHACTNICKAENNVPLGRFRDWVEEHVLGDYPNARPVFVPKLCNHCDDPGCLRACPTGAIHKRPDGIVDLDPAICIACQACMQGCPYGMTFYNHQRGTADKCHLCAHRIDQGLDPACVDICPSQCRIVGDLDDPDSAPSRYLADRHSTVLREDYGLGPNIRYVGLPGELNR